MNGINNIKKLKNDYIGFVYKTTFPDGRFYIGKKLFWIKITRPPLKGTTRKRKCLIESDWESYYGSSEIVKQYLKEGKSPPLIKEILCLCRTKSVLSFMELKYQLDVLTDPLCINNMINVRINGNHLQDIDSKVYTL